uniref:Uncharacterized protein n=1 Tax=uncultured prokaryote TaxID=198431 RepID=H5SEF2_9ZZZZ|nr:hypothetical protein HGMM_F16F12C04 [uncultured prokaryote]
MPQRAEIVVRWESIVPPARPLTQSLMIYRTAWPEIRIALVLPGGAFDALVSASMEIRDGVAGSAVVTIPATIDVGDPPQLRFPPPPNPSALTRWSYWYAVSVVTDDYGSAALVHGPLILL